MRRCGLPGLGALTHPERRPAPRSRSLGLQCEAGACTLRFVERAYAVLAPVLLLLCFVCSWVALQLLRDHRDAWGLYFVALGLAAGVAAVRLLNAAAEDE